MYGSGVEGDLRRSRGIGVWVGSGGGGGEGEGEGGMFGRGLGFLGEGLDGWMEVSK